MPEQRQQTSLDKAIETRMFQVKLQQKRDEVNAQIADIKARAIKAYREKGENDQLSRVLTSAYKVALKIQRFTEVMLSYQDLISLVFGTMETVDKFYSNFMGMMTFSLKTKSTIFTRWKERRKIKKFKKQMRLKFQDLQQRMESINDFADILGDVMDSLDSGEKIKKKKGKGEVVVEGPSQEVLDLRAAAFGTDETGGPAVPPSGSTGGKPTGSGVDTSGLF